MTSGPFKVRGVQQIAIGGPDKQRLQKLWVDMFGLGPTWLGHVVLFEMPDSRLSRCDRQALEEAIGRLSESLPGLSRTQRDKTVRLAMDSMQSVRG